MQEQTFSPRKRERGQSLVEFALVLPIILLMFMGIIDFGRIMFLYSQMSNAVREGARYGSVTGPDSNNPQYANCAGIRDAVRNTLAIPIPAADLTITSAYDDGKTSVGVSCSASATSVSANSIVLGNRIKVTASTDFRFITPILSSFGPIDLTLTSARTILKGGTQVLD